MLNYYKKYTIFVCIIAVALPVIISTIYPLVTGQMMASSIDGLVYLFLLFAIGLFLGYWIFERKAEEKTEQLLVLYNKDCDPQKLVDEGKQLAEAITFPCGQGGAWYLGYYGQALLDIGDHEKAEIIFVGLSKSIQAAKTPFQKAIILANLLPLAFKLKEPEEVQKMIQEGLAFCKQDGRPRISQVQEFFLSQKKILDARESGNLVESIQLDEKIRTNNAYPQRLRVEHAWNEAADYYKLADKAKEKECLEYVVAHGNTLALVSKAKARLANV